MYSNNKKGFSILDLLVKIIFAALFIFIIIWLFQKKIPNINMNAFYSNVFRENMKYMQDAGENYFTNDKLPTEIGESVKLSLEEMEQMNLIIPFVDKDGKSCDIKNSYATVTKLESGYELKTNLVCGKESKQLIKILGCHNYCPTNNCEKSCHVEKIVENQFKKTVEGTKTVYSCNKGYKLSGKYCIQTKLVKSKDAVVKTSETVTETKPAKATSISGKKTPLDTVVTTKTVKLATNVNTSKQLLKTNKTLVPATTKTVKQSYSCPTTEKVKVAYECKKTKKEKQCTTTYQKQSYKCGNCKTTLTNRGNIETCDICYKSVPVQTCKEVKKTYTDTCYREETRTVNKTCEKNVTVVDTPEHYEYSCPSGTDIKEGSGSSLKCYDSVKSYSCPTGTTKSEGSGSSLKCYKSEKTYSCPSGTDVVEGTGSSTKCYKVTDGSVKYECEKGWTLKNKNCTRVTKKSSETKECKDKGYVLEGNKCNLYSTKKVKAKSTKKKVKSVVYKWSTKDTLKGYTKTGQTRTKDGEKVCE